MQWRFIAVIANIDIGPGRQQRCNRLALAKCVAPHASNNGVFCWAFGCTTTVLLQEQLQEFLLLLQKWLSFLLVHSSDALAVIKTTRQMGLFTRSTTLDLWYHTVNVEPRKSVDAQTKETILPGTYNTTRVTNIYHLTVKSKFRFQSQIILLGQW